MGKRHKKTPKIVKANKASPAVQDDTWIKEQAVLLRRAFDLDIKRFKTESPDFAAAFGYWIGYPLFLEWIGFGHDWATLQETIQAYHALNAVHTQATHILMKEAAKRGLDPHALYECGRVIKEIYLADPDLCVNRTTAIYDTWPEGMGAARYLLPGGQQEALRAGEAVFSRLAVAMDITPVAPAMPAQADDLITMDVALSRYKVSRTTIRRKVKEGMLHDYRRQGSAKNATLMLSRPELDRLFDRW